MNAIRYSALTWSAENIPSRASVAPFIYRLIFLFLITVPGNGLQAQQAKEKKSMASVETATPFAANDSFKTAERAAKLVISKNAKRKNASPITIDEMKN